MDYVGIFKVIYRIERLTRQEDNKVLVGDYEGAEKYFKIRKQELDKLLQKCRGKTYLLQKYMEKYADL